MFKASGVFVRLFVIILVVADHTEQKSLWIFIVDEHSFENILAMVHDHGQFLVFELSGGDFVLDEPFIDLLEGLVGEDLHTGVEDESYIAFALTLAIFVVG